MSIWQDTFNGQQPVQKIKEALRLLESAKTDKLNGNDLAAFARLLKALKIILAYLEHLDPELYPQNIWAGIGQSALNLQNYANAFSQNPNASALNSSNSMADQIIASLRPNEQNSAAETVKAVFESSHSFQSKISEELEQIRKTVADEKTAVAAITKSINDEQTKLNGLTTLIEQQKGRLDQAIANYQQQFTSAETTRTATFTNDSKKRFDDFQEFLKLKEAEIKKSQGDNKNAIDELFKTLEQKSEQHLERLKSREEEVDRIFGAIGTSAFAGHFKNTADSERTSANWLRGTALVLMVIMIGVAGLAFYLSFTHEINLHTFIFRFGTMVVIAIPAVYAAQESSRHRERENNLRKMYLELSSIDAYLVLLPADQRNEIKAKLTDKFFGREESENKEESVSKHALFDLLSSVLKNLTKGK